MADLNHDIEKYLRGELSSSEMHALEKKALHDPFLAEALEGAESVSSRDFTDDALQLRAAIQSRVQKDSKKVVPLWLLIGRIAAGLLVLIVSGYIVMNVFDKDEDRGNLALNKSIDQPKHEPPATGSRQPSKETNISPVPVDVQRNDQSISKKESGDNDHGSSTPPVSAETIEPQQIEKEQRIPEPEVLATDDEPKYDSIVTLAAPMVEQKFDAEDRKSKSVASVRDHPSGAVQRSAFAKAEEKKLPAVVVHGTVTDENNEPLPGVNVTIKGSNDGVITGVDGTYHIPLDDINAELVFSFIGMEPVDVRVATNEAINVKMQEDVSQLSEVVVAGYTSPQDAIDREKEPSIYHLAEPEGGRRAFKKYLVDNMRYPERAIENKIQGKVTVQFTIQQSGLLDDFKVLKSLGYGCDEEVIRLIRQGPKWSPTRRNAEPLKGKVKVRLRFQLPK